MKDHIICALTESKACIESLLENEQKINRIQKAAEILIQTFQQRKRVFSCGNGGSMCDAIHFAEELTGRYRSDRRGLSAVAISDPGHLSCVANDFGYEMVFARYIESHAETGDSLIGISTSGSSRNVIEAAVAAKRYGMNIITLTGRECSPLGSIADIDICLPCGDYSDRVQEMHIKVIHILIELVERMLFPEAYKSNGKS